MKRSSIVLSLIFLPSVILLLVSSCWAGVDLRTWPDHDYIDFGTGPSITGTGDYTFSCWFNRATMSALEYIYGDRDVGGGWQNAWVVESTDGNIRFAAYGAAGWDFDATTAGSAYDDGKWHNVICIRTGGSGYIYVDGIADGSDAGGAAATLASWRCVLGYNYRDSTAMWEGLLNEVAIWTTALNATERSLLANSKIKGIPLQIQPDSLVAYWPLNDISSDSTTTISNTIFYDRAGTNNGTGIDADGDCKVIPEAIMSYP